MASIRVASKALSFVAPLRFRVVLATRAQPIANVLRSSVGVGQFGSAWSPLVSPARASPQAWARGLHSSAAVRAEEPKQTPAQSAVQIPAGGLTETPDEWLQLMPKQTEEHVPSEQKQQPETMAAIPTAYTEPSYLFVSFTCDNNNCGNKIAKHISKDAYQKGVVLCKCSKCGGTHLMADRLGWMREGNVDVEALLKARGRGDEIRKGGVGRPVLMSLDELKLFAELPNAQDRAKRKGPWPAAPVAADTGPGGGREKA